MENDCEEEKLVENGIDYFRNVYYNFKVGRWCFFFIDYDFLDSLKKATDQIMARVCVVLSSLSEKDIRFFLDPRFDFQYVLGEGRC